MNTHTPYYNLDPHTILNAVESLGFHCTGSLLSLNSYENRVYQVGIEESEPVIAKFYRPYRWTTDAILEEHQFADELMMHELPVVAPLKIGMNQTLHEYQGFRFALFPRQSGRPLELDNMEQLEWIGRFIGRLHAIGACKPFIYRIQIDVENFGYSPYQFLVQSQFIPSDLKHNYCLIVEAILQKCSDILKAMGKIDYLRLHGDCHAGNILWDARGPHIVDLDDCLMGPAIQDIWMLLSGHHASEVNKQLSHILQGYYEFYDFNLRELYLVEVFRSLRMIHYSAWLAKRWQDPSFPLNFPWFNTSRYWEGQIQDYRDQWVLLEESMVRELPKI